MENGEQYFYLIAESFKSPNKDVESFLKTKSVHATRLNTATTYLVYNEISSIKIDLVGYFSLAMKMLTIKKTSLSASKEKIINRFGYYDADSDSYKIPAILIAQFGRNYDEKSSSIPGLDLMDICLKQIKNILSFLSGKTVFLECEKNQKLIQFYKEKDFILLDNEVFSKNSKELIQMYRLL
jgi:hypothetical protein